ncbi:hypothetical protein [Caldibacillus debilis]|nr:hypothetical protein [Caldibacillus debilis]
MSTSLLAIRMEEEAKKEVWI